MRTLPLDSLAAWRLDHAWMSDQQTRPIADDLAIMMTTTDFLDPLEADSLVRDRATLLYQRSGRTDAQGRVWLDDEYCGVITSTRTAIDVIAWRLIGGW